MNQLINTKELCKQLRFCGNHGSVIWSREESQDFISNRHFLVRFEEVPRDVLATLFGIFYKLPTVGETLHSYSGDVIEVTKPIDFSKIYIPEQQNIEGEKTSYLRDFGNKLLVRAIKFSQHYSFIDEKYMKLEASGEKPKTNGDSPHAPVYMAGGNLMLLPYRTTDGNQVLDDLLGVDKQ